MSSQPEAAPSPSVRRRRGVSLSVKVALVAFAGFYLHDEFRPTIDRWVFELFLRRPAAAERFDSSAVFRRLVTTPTDTEPANDLQADLRKLEDWNNRRSTLVSVYDRDEGLRFRSKLLSDIQGDVGAARMFRLQVGGKIVGGGFVLTSSIIVDDSLMGWRRSLYFSLRPGSWSRKRGKDAPILRLDPDSEFLTLLNNAKARSDAALARSGRVRRWASVGVSIAISVFLALALSLLITRRIRRLARDAAAAPEGELSGPFVESGRDEISTLAKVLNERRDKILGLIQGMRQQDRQRREWIAQVSHDLRTPLTAIEICLHRIQRDATGEQRKNVDLAVHDCQRLRTLTDNLLEVGRLEMGQGLELEPVLPQEVVTAAARSTQPLAEERGVQLEVKTIQAEGSEAGEQADSEIEADGGRLLRACENLIRNAIRHARERVRVFVEASATTLRFVVLDDGPGFGGGAGPVKLGEFETPGSHIDSAGLGLVVSRCVAEAHGGQIGAVNGAEGWTRVWIEIPR